MRRVAGPRQAASVRGARHESSWRAIGYAGRAPPVPALRGVAERTRPAPATIPSKVDPFGIEADLIRAEEYEAVEALDVYRTSGS